MIQLKFGTLNQSDCKCEICCCYNLQASVAGVTDAWRSPL